MKQGGALFSGLGKSLPRALGSYYDKYTNPDATCRAPSGTREEQPPSAGVTPPGPWALVHLPEGPAPRQARKARPRLTAREHGALGAVGPTAPGWVPRQRLRSAQKGMIESISANHRNWLPPPPPHR